MYFVAFDGNATEHRKRSAAAHPEEPVSHQGRGIDLTTLEDIAINRSLEEVAVREDSIVEQFLCWLELKPDQLLAALIAY